MSELPARFRLPLMHHLMKQRVRDAFPAVPAEMTPSDHDLVHSGRREPELAKPPPHPAGESHPDSSQCIVEVDPIELIVQLVQAGKDLLVARPDGRTARR
jgi:hypothetical protein